jgi:hypothetical protein
MNALPEVGQPRFNGFKPEPIVRAAVGVPSRVFWTPALGMVVVYEPVKRAA